MCGLARRLCLLLWMAAVCVPRTQGQVTAAASLTAEAGQPITLSCNITRATGDNVWQVRWLNRRNKKLLTYTQSTPVRIIHQEAGVQLNASDDDASSITIQKVQAADEGCYRCIFDVFPSGLQEGKTCIRVTGQVRLEGNRTAVSGQPVTLSCRYTLPERVHQVLWRKTAEQGDTTTVAWHAKRGQHNIEEAYRGRVSLSHTVGDTQFTIDAVRTEDEACYTCHFHTYPDGIRRATSCLSVYVLPKPQVSHVTSSLGVTEANCTTQSRPAAELAWDLGGDNRTLGPPVLSVYEEGDGTTTVTSTLLLQSALLSELSVKCIVHHPGLKEPISLSLHSPVSPAVVVLLSVCGVVAVLVLCFCVCLCKCFICTDD